MAHPKRKHSTTRRDKKRTHQKLSMPAVSVCPVCNQMKQPHSVCSHCGQYKEEKYIQIKEKKKKN
ncbi:MAG: 50S ribosomal protein L32 [Candidatus Omnitrophota bacterium]|nr:MAG: 50S ribosomal protein L32 [Candidatus Omnitrophota bacterium]